MEWTRREVLAAPLVAVQPAVNSDLVRRHDDYLDKQLASQITQAGHPQRGGAPDANGLYSAYPAAGLLSAGISALVTKESKHSRSASLRERLKLAIGYLEGKQHADGTVDLLSTNFHSTPDLGFVVHSVAGAAWIAHAYGEPELFDALKPFLKKAGDALAVGGVHTPNHRWVVCEALGQINEVLPDKRYTARAEQWLAEGIDIEDGIFSERSTTVYNPVCCDALLVAALKLQKPELLDPVRKCLEAMLYLVHPDGDVVTEISTRQDLNTRAGMERYWFPLRWFAIKDGDGRWAELVRRLEPRAASLAHYLRFPEISAPLPPSATLPEKYEKAFPSCGLARIRRGATSASVIGNGASRLFTLRHGDVVIEAVRASSAFFGKGQFKPASLGREGAAYTLTQSLTGPYYQPVEPSRRVTSRELGAARMQRRQSEVQKMDYTARIEETAKGFRLRLTASGTAQVPLAIEIAVREGGTIEGARRLGDRDLLLESGFATLSRGGRTIRVGPGLGQHSYVEIRGAEPLLPGQRLHICGLTPFDHTLEFELG